MEGGTQQMPTYLAHSHCARGKGSNIAARDEKTFRLVNARNPLMELRTNWQCSGLMGESSEG